jgi:hypothetical protein
MLISYDLLFEILTEVDTNKAKSESGIDRRKPGNITLEDFLAKIGSAINDASGKSRAYCVHNKNRIHDYDKCDQICDYHNTHCDILSGIGWLWLDSY